MDVTVNQKDSHVLISIVGSVKLTDADSLYEAFKKVLDNSNQSVIVDLSLVPSMSSLGIGKLIFLNQRLEAKDRKMEIRGIHKNLFNLFKSMKLDRIISMTEA